MTVAKICNFSMNLNTELISNSSGDGELLRRQLLMYRLYYLVTMATRMLLSTLRFVLLISYSIYFSSFPPESEVVIATTQ